MRLRTTTDEQLGLLMVTATGGVGRHSADGLRRVFDVALATGHRRVLVDLTGLADVDEAVAATFLRQDELLTSVGGWLWIVHGTDALGAALREAGVAPRVRTSRRATRVRS
jgi:anti-anti-sigma regulatory factor